MRMFLLQNTMSSFGDTWEPYDPDNPDPDPPPPDPEIAKVGLYQVDPSITEGTSATFEVRRSGNVNVAVETLIDAQSSGGDVDLVINPTYEYQWTRNGDAITGANSATYTLTAADVGKAIRCTVALRNTIGRTVATSNAITMSGGNASLLPFPSGATVGGASSVSSWAAMRGRALDCIVLFPGQTLGDPVNSGWNGEYATWPQNGAWNDRLTTALATAKIVSITIPLMNYTDRDNFNWVATCPASDELIVAHNAIANLIKGKLGTREIILRLGHEANAGNKADPEDRPDDSEYRYCWHYYSQAGVFANAADYIAAWARIANIYKGIIGPTKALLDWNMVWQHSTYSRVNTYFPGSSVVDIISLDQYDNGGGNPAYWIDSDANWALALGDYSASTNGGSARGLAGILAFAKLKGKLFAVPEWAPLVAASTSGGNNSYYPGKMFNFLKDNAAYVAYEAYFNSDASHQIDKTAPRLPLTRAAYIAAWKP